MKAQHLTTRHLPQRYRLGQAACKQAVLGLAVAGLASLASVTLPAYAQLPDLSKALSQLPEILRNSSSGSKPADAIGAVLGSNSSSASNTSVQGADLMQLLSQPDIDAPREQEIGRQLSAVLLGSKPLSPDMGLQRYINQLGRWISLQSSRPDLPWAFAVLDDNGFNAFAAPGGYVFVTKGLINQISDEAELAGILAHEITHVTEKHHLKAMKSAASSGATTKLGAQLLGSQVKNDTLRGIISDQGLSLVRDLYSRGLDRDDEFEADRTAVALAARAGFDPYGLVSVLQGLRTASPDNPMFALSLSTHPPTQQRLDQLESSMGNRLDGMAGKNSISVAQRLERLKASGQLNAPPGGPASIAPARRNRTAP